MSTFNSWEFWIPFLQIQVAASGAICVAIFAGQLIAPQRVIAREWLWRG